MRVSDFHFDLPEELIAQHPPEVRGSSRMLVLDRAATTDPLRPALIDDVFTSLPHYLQPGDLLVLNDSRVLPARLFATRAGLTTQHNSPRPAGLIEVLLTEQIADASEPEANLWHALVKPARKVLAGETLLFHAPPTNNAVILSAAKDPYISPTPALTAEVIAAGEFGERTLRFAPIANPNDDFYAILSRIGHMPLPPYIARDQSTQPDSPEDRTRYQTVYAEKPGSAAAPTAGQHFTQEVLAALTARGVQIATLTLHVGLGTFQPVRVSEVKDIRLHSERYTLPAATAEALNRALAEGRRIVAVGTTTTRTLEHIAQQAQLTTENGARTTVVTPHSGQTSIFLAPGHRFRIVSGLLTNFHLPESTLLMLVSAFAGNRPLGVATKPGAPFGVPGERPLLAGVAHLHSETWEEPPQNPGGQEDDPNRGRQTIQAAYAHAIHHRYRFYSYGDCMLLL